MNKISIYESYTSTEYQRRHLIAAQTGTLHIFLLLIGLQRLFGDIQLSLHQTPQQ